MALVYHCHLEFTAEQREADSDHGIFESLTRTLSLDPGAKTFSYDFHYYYEYEGVGYNLITCTKNDTKFQGTYEQQGNKIVATITGGTQNATDDVAKTVIFNTDQITGRLQFAEDGAVLKVAMAEHKPEGMDRRDSIIAVDQVFKKQS